MEAALVAGALALGLAGVPHCTAMCATPCAAVIGRGGLWGTATFHVGRTVGYAVAGAVAAGGLSAFGTLAQAAPLLQPLWVLVQAGFLALGLWLLWQGRQPSLLMNLAPAGTVLASASGGGVSPAPGWSPVRVLAREASGSAPASLRAAAGGALWFAWPCGLLQSALLVAALASSALGGAVTMATFAVASSAGLWLGPWLWRRLGRPVAGAEPLALRLAGLLMAVMAGWALSHGLWERVAAYCASP